MDIQEIGLPTLRTKEFININSMRLAGQKDMGPFMGSGRDVIFRELSALGFDGIRLSVDGDTHYAIFDPDNIHTRKELEDYYNEHKESKSLYPALKSASDWCIKHSIEIPDDVTAGLYQFGIDVKTPGYYAGVMWESVRTIAGDIEAYDFEEVMLD